MTVIVMYKSVVDVRNRVRGCKYEDTESVRDSGMDTETVCGKRSIAPRFSTVDFRGLGCT